MELGEAIRLRRTELGMSQADLAKAADVDARQIRRYEAGEQQPLFTVAVAIATALRVPLTELAGLQAEHAEGTDRVLPRVRHGIEFTTRDDSNGELRITGDDDAAILLWGAAWLDEHREWIIDAMRFQHPAWPGDDSLTSTVIIEVVSPGTFPPGHPGSKPRLGPWSHGVPPMPV
ncbi:MAG: helix-turn-helix transcriptional regulator [Trebonia sp.]